MSGTVRVRRDDLVDFLRARAADRPARPAGPEGLCVLSGGIVARNLTERLAAESVPADLAATTTVEDLAGDLVAADRGVRPGVLDRPVRKRAIDAVLRAATDRDTPLGRFARRVPFESPEVLDAVAGELNEYHRCTDAASDADHEALLSVVDAVDDDNPFAAEATRESVRAFRALDRRLRGLVEDGRIGDGSDEGSRNHDGGSGDDAVGGGDPDGDGGSGAGPGDPAPFVSRSHLVRAARTGLHGAWAGATGDPDWVAVATVSALDNPTTRLLLSIAATGTTVHLFAGAGTADYFRRRLRAAVDGTASGTGSGPGDPDGSDPGGAGTDRPDPTGVAVRGPEGDPTPESEAGAALLSAAASHDRVAAPPGVSSVAAPDRRREVEYAVRAARRAEGSTLLVARDAGEYETPLRDVALTADRPYRVETRREVRSVPTYRALAATVELLSAADAGAVSPRDLLDPLRLGVVIPEERAEDGRSGSGSDDGTRHGGGSVDEDRGSGGSDDDRSVGPREGWPLPAATVRELRGLVGRGVGPERPLAEWRETVAGGEGAARREGLAFLEWIGRLAGDPPGDGRALRATLARVLDARTAALRDREHRTPSGIAVETGRAGAADPHPVYYAARVRSALGAAAGTYDFLRGALEHPADWETALAALRHGTGAESYGRPNHDADAVEVVDAGNAHFRRADRVFVLGLAAERFPGAPRRPAFLRRDVREALYRRATEFPFLYLDGEAAGYGRDLDAYEAALRAAREAVTLVRPYKDTEGRDVAHSPFLDAVDLDDAARTRIDLGDWVGIGDAHRDSTGSTEGTASGPGGTGDGWDDLWAALGPKERLRALARYAERPAGRGPDADELERLAARIDDPEVRRRVRRRVERFRERLEDDDD